MCGSGPNEGDFTCRMELIMCGSGPNEGDFTCRMEAHHVWFRSQ